MIHLPFFNKYPYTNMEAVNIDWLLNEVGQYSKRITDLETITADHEERLTTAEGEIDELQLITESHETRITQAEGDIDALEGRMDTAEGKISDLESSMGTAQDDISDLKSRMQTAEGDIDSLEGRMDTAEGEIDAIQLKDSAQDNDIIALDQRVTTLENESAVIANPGGTGSNLNTISIDNVTYVIPSGGGGGGGSSVTPNPAGTPTDTLDKVDIDGTIYGMPITAAEVTALNGTISDIQGDISDLDDRNEWTEHLFSDDTMTATGSVQHIYDSDFTLTEDGLYLVTAYLDVDTSNYGSAPRDIGFYLRKYNSGGTEGNIFMDKAHISGSENPMITQSTILKISMVMPFYASSELDYVRHGFYVRVQGSTNKQFTINYFKAEVIKLRELEAPT